MLKKDATAYLQKGISASDKGKAIQPNTQPKDDNV
jgi:hypothetical protein